ncbi:MAG: hypothetical protein EHM20_13610 [Alphaproteobacteria bacterium]|nr:MAG: hypothetical protein EHM20_13610 [Alphaproteobacteria bacterium]
MARKLADIEKSIKESSIDFYTHLARILPPAVWDFLNVLMSRTDVYLFSGVIRNYFINRKNDALRDIDFIITKEVNIDELFPEMNVRKNSFGGSKIFIGGLTVDLWMIKSTWALNQGQMKMEFDLLNHLPDTTFFNFSSILFSLKDKKFIIGKHFLRFLRDKKLDVVLETNPYPALCIVNSFYYANKFNLKLSGKLEEYILKNYRQNIELFDQTQLKHFGRIMYSQTELIHRIKLIESY